MYGFSELTPGTFIAIVIGLFLIYIIYKLIFSSDHKH